MRHIEKLPSFVMLEFNSGDQSEDMRRLKDAGLKFKAGRGSYKGVSNPSYLVLFKDLRDLRAIINLANESKQESILMVDVDRKCELVYLDTGNRLDIGKWTEVERWELDGRDAYSELDGRLFVAV